jgi:general secretion pathway protein A
MYEDYYGLSEKPFSLTPDPKYLFRSDSHKGALQVLHYALDRREGFMVVTGDIGTGKTTLCRALIEQLNSKTFTALVLNPFISEEDLLKQILLDFGVVSREDVKRGYLTTVSKQDMIDTLNDFLLSLLPIGASAIVIIDEAQNLPPAVLEQIRILSNLETDKEKLLQIVLVGQLNLQTLLRAPELRQLDQRISIRCRLEPLSRDEVNSYVAHRLSVASGGAPSVAFTLRAIERVHAFSAGVPRLVNLVCDRALLCAYSERRQRVLPSFVLKAAESLELPAAVPGVFRRIRRRVALALASAGASAVIGAAGLAFAQHQGFTDVAVRQMAVPPAPVIARTAAYEAPAAPVDEAGIERAVSARPEPQVLATSGGARP